MRNESWDGLARPFDEIDFERRDDVPMSGWPITRAELEPYYERAAHVAHLEDSSLSLASVRERDAFAPLPVGGGRLVTRIAQQVPSGSKSFGDAYADEIRRATNVVAYLHANVMEIETNDSARTATSVRVATLSGNRFRVHAGTFVVAAGGIENPRLLLASRRRRPRGLGNDHDLVGRYFLEHPRWVAGKLLPADRHLRTRFYDVHRLGSTTIKGYIALADHVKRVEGLRDVQISIHPNPAPSFARASVSQDAGSARALLSAGRVGRDLINVAGDLMTWQTFTVPGAPLPLPYPEVARELIGSAPARREQLVPTLAGDLAGLAFKRAGRAPVASLPLTTRVEPMPNPDSRVTLIAERDALGMNRVKLDWRLSRQDRHVATRALELLAVEIGGHRLGRVRIEDDANEEAWPPDLAGGWHHMGTTRMSHDPRQGVVDTDCRVHGMSNLFIAGSSVFPNAGAGTPTLTLVALALRLADHLERVTR